MLFACPTLVVIVAVGVVVIVVNGTDFLVDDNAFVVDVIVEVDGSVFAVANGTVVVVVVVVIVVAFATVSLFWQLLQAGLFATTQKYIPYKQPTGTILYQQYTHYTDTHTETPTQYQC